jgi:hypothetical protein
MLPDNNSGVNERDWDLERINKLAKNQKSIFLATIANSYARYDCNDRATRSRSLT